MVKPYVFILIQIVLESVSGFDVQSFLSRSCRQEDTLHCSNFVISTTDDYDIQTQNFIISTTRSVTFSNCASGMINENFLSKFPEATYIRFLNCSMHLTPSVKAVGPKTHPVNTFIVENSTIYDDVKSNAFQSATDLDRIFFILTTFESKVIDNYLLQYNKKLTTVVFENCSIKDIHAQAFNSLANLEHLNLNSNLLTTIDSDLLKNNKKIKFVSIERNLLTYIPADIILNKTLEYLSFEGNLIEALSQYQLIGLKSLKHLNFRLNLIATLSEGAFDDCTSLTKLDLSFNRISELTKVHFKPMKNLNYLNLANNPLNKLPNNVFDGLPKLRTLITRL